MSEHESPVPKRLFFVSLLAVVFLYGVSVGAYHLFPFGVLDYLKDSAEAVWDDREMLSGAEPVSFLQAARHEGSGVSVWDREGAYAGLTLMSGFFEEDNGLRLVDMDGTVLNRWRLRFSELWPDPDHVMPSDRVPTTDWHVDVEGIVLFPDGSVAFNFAGLGLTKMDRCGRVIWQLPRMTHHSLEPSMNGGFWVPEARHVDGSDGNPFEPLIPPYLDHVLVEISPSGDVVREISLLDVFFRNRLQALILANGAQAVAIPLEDPLHLNDIEELTPEDAAAFPLFEAGDLLLSLRDLNLIMVLDPDDLVVKWYRTGPWIRQHDPDFDEGAIIVYNNNTDDAGGRIFGGSNIMRATPGTGEVEIVYGDAEGQAFYSTVRGKHQRLPNGNLLVTEHEFGRFFEVDPSGTIVWEYVNRYDSDRIAKVTQAIRYPSAYIGENATVCE